MCFARARTPVCGTRWFLWCGSILLGASVHTVVARLRTLPGPFLEPCPAGLKNPASKCGAGSTFRSLIVDPFAVVLIVGHPGNEFRPSLLKMTESWICTVFAIDGWKLPSNTVMLTRMPTESDT